MWLPGLPKATRAFTLPCVNLGAANKNNRKRRFATREQYGKACPPAELHRLLVINNNLLMGRVWSRSVQQQIVVSSMFPTTRISERLNTSERHISRHTNETEPLAVCRTAMCRGRETLLIWHMLPSKWKRRKWSEALDATLV